MCCIYRSKLSLQTADSIPFVYKKDGTREVVVLGESNENDIIVDEGLKEGDKLLLSQPENPEKYKLTGEDLIATIKERKAEKAREEEAAPSAKRQKAARNNAGQYDSGTDEGVFPESYSRTERGNASAERCRRSGNGPETARRSST